MPLFQDCPAQGSSIITLTLSSFSTKSNVLKVKKNNQILNLKSMLVRWRKPGHLVISKPTSTSRYITLCGYYYIALSYRSLILQCPLVIYLYRGIILSSKKVSSLVILFLGIIVYQIQLGQQSVGQETGSQQIVLDRTRRKLTNTY